MQEKDHGKYYISGGENRREGGVSEGVGGVQTRGGKR